MGAGTFCAQPPITIRTEKTTNKKKTFFAELELLFGIVIYSPGGQSE